MPSIDEHPSLVTANPRRTNTSPLKSWPLLAPVLASAAFVLELTLTPATLPAIRDTFGVELAELSRYLNVYSFTVALGVLTSGILGDKYKAEDFFSMGTLLFCIGCFLVLLSQNVNILLLARSIQGLGAGLFLPMAPVLLARAVPEKTGRALIVCGAISGYLAAFAPLIYGYLFDGGNWAAPYTGLAVLSLLAFILSNLSSRQRSETSINRSLSSWTSLFMTKGLVSIYLYIFCTYGAVTYYLFKLPILTSDSGFSSAELGGVLSILWITFSTFSIMLRNLVDSGHISTVLSAAPVSLATAVGLLCLTPSSLVLTTSAFLVGVGLACSNAPSTQVVLKLAPKELHSLSSSLDFASARLGGMASCTMAVLFFPHLQFIILLCLLAVALTTVSVFSTAFQQIGVLHTRKLDRSI